MALQHLGVVRRNPSSCHRTAYNAKISPSSCRSRSDRTSKERPDHDQHDGHTNPSSRRPCDEEETWRGRY
eukprot:2188473-Pyramimonas_sp.AAC.1